MAAMAGLFALSLTIALRLLPEVTVTPFSPGSATPSAALAAEAGTPLQQLSTTERNPGLQRHRSRVPETKVQRVHTRLVSSTSQSPTNIRGVSSTSPHPSEPQPVRGPLWRVIPNAGGWAFRSVKSGFSKVGSHLGFGRHQKEPPAQLGQ